MSETRRSVSAGAWLLPAVGHAVILLALLARLLISGPAYDRTFRDFNMKLPAYTYLVITVSRWLELYWYVLVPLVVVLIVANTVILWRLGGLARRPGWLWFWIVAGAMLSLWVLVEVSFLLPLRKLYEGLEK